MIPRTGDLVGRRLGREVVVDADLSGVEVELRAAPGADDPAAPPGGGTLHHEVLAVADEQAAAAGEDGAGAVLVAGVCREAAGVPLNVVSLKLAHHIAALHTRPVIWAVGAVEIGGAVPLEVELGGAGEHGLRRLSNEIADVVDVVGGLL